MYDMAGAPHAITPKREVRDEAGNLDWTPISRALLLHLDAWIARGTEPPATILMALETAAPGSRCAHRRISRRRDPGSEARCRRQHARRNRLPDVEAPLGTHVGLNSTHTRGCMLVGGYVPFDARQNRAHYKNRDDYVNRIRVSARKLVMTGSCCRKTRRSSCRRPRRATPSRRPNN
jgi:hypothetical protein